MAEQKPAPKRVVPRGKALRRTDAELDELTSVEAMENLADEASEDWRENAARGVKTLLDAKGESEDA